ncbi:DNA-binding response regulator [Comamonas serinivorans]|uniref:DNA-binding response regulator n=1 Tax=Comamonas serinivorans TaxID=1082851 RepID=A0A1Y0EJJ5_9BURK|nr:LytTR family DNA-binding domain-containing protein [Comamonas serinivorans]ARU03608.1 DNA-binding response regulator [Comamonas serinivorans]
MPTALIADDEPLLAQALQAELSRLWPELQVLASVGDGLSAAREALRLQPQVVFLDIRMPGQDGLAAAAQIADEWPEDAGPLPALVFVTAYEQHAVQAFDAQALDYVLKPMDRARLMQTVQRLQQQLARVAGEAGLGQPTVGAALAGGTAAPAAADPVAQWQALLQAAGAALQPAQATPRLRFIQAAGVGGHELHLVSVDQVLYFEAADKYVRVITRGADDGEPGPEYLIRTPLRQLLAQLPDDLFWQVQRGLLVRADAIARVQREESGKLWLQLRGRPASERLPVGRLYAGLFKAM